MNKRILSILLAMCMVLALLPSAAFAEEATVDIMMALRAVDQEGNEIEGTLDVTVNQLTWIASTDAPQTYTCNVGENVLTDWDYCPVEYKRPTEDITFTADAEGNITLTSDNATVSVEDGVTYFTVVLEKAETVTLNLALRALDIHGNEVPSVGVSLSGNTALTATPSEKVLPVGQNELGTFYLPEQYMGPLSTISFTVDAEGNMEITSGDAVLVTENGVTYIQVTLYKWVAVPLLLKPVDSDGNPISCEIEVQLNDWWQLNSVEPRECSLYIGPNYTSSWYQCPDGYIPPEETIIFNCDEEGVLTVTDGNASVEVIDGVTCIVIPLEEDLHEHTYGYGLYYSEGDLHYKKCDTCDEYDPDSGEAHVDEDGDCWCEICWRILPHEHTYLRGFYIRAENGHYKECDYCYYYDESSFEAHFDDDGDYYCDACFEIMPHEHTYLRGLYTRAENGHYKECDICTYYDEASYEAHIDADSNDICDDCVQFLGDYRLAVSNGAGQQLNDRDTVFYGDVLTAVYSDTVTYMWVVYDYTVPGEGGSILMSDTPTCILKPDAFAGTNGILYLRILHPDTNELLDSMELYVKGSILEHPSSAEASVGETARFSVEAREGDWSYKWQYSINGGKAWYAVKSFEGKNADTLYVPVTAARNGFLYRCVLTDSDGYSEVSEAAQLSLTAQSSIVVTSEPFFGMTAEGTTAPISVIAEGEGLTYKWQYSTNGGTSWYASKSFEGKNTDTLYVPVTAARDGFLYRCVITDANGYTVISGVAELNVQ